MLHFYLVRGLIRESRHWGDFPGLLQQAFPGCRMTAIDIPGAGTRHHVASPTRVDAMVRQMRGEFLKTRVNGEIPVLIVISLGGMIAAQWMHDFPEDFVRAVLINTSFGSLSPFYQRMKPLAALSLLNAVVLHPRDREARILRLVSNHEEHFEAGLSLWKRIENDRRVSLKNAISQLLAAARFGLGDWRPLQPVLLLAGTQDRLVSVECSRAIAHAWQVPLQEHASGGHDLSIDAPEWLIAKIHAYLAGVQGTAG